MKFIANKYKLLNSLSLLVLLQSCAGQGPVQNQPPALPQVIHSPAPAVPAPKPGPQIKPGQPKTLNAAALSQLGLHLPGNQSQWDQLPPQPGQNVLGVTVKGGPNQDTNWTATTLVLFLNHNGSWEVMTQKRSSSMSNPGTIETPGGHLTGNQSWRDGARAELQQEAGVQVKNSALLYLTGGKPAVGAKGNLFGHVNFFVVFTGSKPSTAVNGHEVDAHYGHQWLPLQQVYQSVKSEQNAMGKASGVYYSSFRQQLIKFVEQVL